MTRDEMQELKRLAEAATPGPWHAFSRQKPWHAYDCNWAIGSEHLHVLASLDSPQTSANLRLQDDARYIAAANPAVVLALIARIEELEGE